VPAQNDYELIDFGAGRKLERFGTVVIDRPSPAAERDPPARPDLWRTATARYVAKRAADGEWSPQPTRWTPENWQFEHRLSARDKTFRLQLDALPSGQVGVFPEQGENWDWIARQLLRRQGGPRPIRVLNLFAYTGGSTLAASAGGAEVAHVDAARAVVNRARQNAALSGSSDLPVRWIVEDAMKFASRELKRGNRYEGVILDPPTYGHGAGGQSWKIERDLLPLLKLCGELTMEDRLFVLITCHTPGIGPGELAAYLGEGIFGNCSQPPAAGELFLSTTDGRRLPSGVFARWPR
jgi:23S rRNA (cytosine1962-C5)-methyltransferase